jgi:pyruvate dehydrogenase E1 component alpha subunit
MASAWDLPIVYVIENNLYGISVGLKRVTKVVDLSVRAQGYGMKGISIDGNDVLKVYETVKEAVDYARLGNGPTLIECKTYRHKGHHVGDPGLEYRTREEEEEWKARCPLSCFKDYLLKEKKATKEVISELELSIIEEIKEAVEFAKNSPYPDPSEAFEDIYA